MLNYLLIAAAVVIMPVVAYLLYLYYHQMQFIRFYEKQDGVVIYPHSRMPVIGYMQLYQVYLEKRASTAVVEVEEKWFTQNIDQFRGIKETERDKNQWFPLLIMYLFGLKECVISDPKVIADAIVNENIDKESFLKKYILDKRLSDNVLTLKRSKTQVQRRRAMVNCFSGSSNFKIIDEKLNTILTQYFERWSKSETIDLRQEMISIFEDTMATYLLGSDVGNFKQKMLVTKADNSVVQESQGVFAAMNTCFDTSLLAVDMRMLLGETRTTHKQRVSLDNWLLFCEMLDGIVEKRKETFFKDKDTDDLQPSSLLDLLLMSEVYEQNVTKITNELVIAMLAATETSRNASIFTLCQLTKKKEFRNKVRDEVKASLTKYGLSSAIELTHKHTTSQDLEFLSWMINETLRFNPPAPTTELYEVQRNCQLGQYQFRKGDMLNFYIHGVHRDPNQWQKPHVFNPYRFDPENELFKTPDGKQRHPLSLVPFSMGERKCIGYNLANVMMPTIISKIAYDFDMEFVDQNLYEEDVFVVASALQNHQYPIMMKIKSAYGINAKS